MSNNHVLLIFGNEKQFLRKLLFVLVFYNLISNTF